MLPWVRFCNSITFLLKMSFGNHLFLKYWRNSSQVISTGWRFLLIFSLSHQVVASLESWYIDHATLVYLDRLQSPKYFSFSIIHALSHALMALPSNLCGATLWRSSPSSSSILPEGPSPWWTSTFLWTQSSRATHNSCSMWSILASFLFKSSRIYSSLLFGQFSDPLLPISCLLITIMTHT